MTQNLQLKNNNKYSKRKRVHTQVYNHHNDDS
jgi:hypothetical protein